MWSKSQRKLSERVFILGSGESGSRALASVQTLFRPAKLTMVDMRPERLKQAIAAGGNALVMDAISFLISSSHKMDPDDWIIPAVPLHVAWEWLRRKSYPGIEIKKIRAPEALESLLPNPMRGADGQLFASNADFICPPDCLEPDECCTITGEPRPQILCEALSNLKLAGYHSTCIVSEQLAPGVGGYQFRALLRARKALTRHPGKILVSTSCKCHCVVHALSCQSSKFY
jgi:hypothetical protein